MAARLSKICNGSDRAGKQCRERYLILNQGGLITWICQFRRNRGVKMKKKLFFKCIIYLGINGKRSPNILNQGTEISYSRTENDIKNHFYATMRKGIRRLNKLLGFKQNPSDIKRIKPVVLSKLCEEQQQLEVPPIDKF